MSSGPRVTVSGRVFPATVDRLDRCAEELSRRRPGEVVKRSDVLRIAIERGVDVLEQDLGLTAAEPPAPPPEAKPAPKGGKRPARKPAK